MGTDSVTEGTNTHTSIAPRLPDQRLHHTPPSTGTTLHHAAPGHTPRRAGWAVSPANYVLAGSHIFNVIAQSNQLRRALMYQVTLRLEPSTASDATLACAAPALRHALYASNFNPSRTPNPRLEPHRRSSRTEARKPPRR